MRACILFLFLGMFSGCKPGSREHVIRGFYYWKSSFALSPAVLASLDTLGVQTLYIKAFDVDWDEAQRAVPKAPLRLHAPLPSQNIVPVVFITNRVLEKLDTAEITSFAAKLLSKTGHCFKGYDRSRFREYQLDCDWTAGTREKFFSLVKQFRQLIKPARLSVTIRLHQLAHLEKTGVPPADKGMLMMYNTGILTDPATRNSILDVEQADQYLRSRKEYPLPLDVALPLFSWSALFRNGRFAGLLNNLDRKGTEKHSFFRKKTENVYYCLADTVCNNVYFREGDELRVEEVKEEELLEIARKTRGIVSGDTLSVVFFHLDPSTLNPRLYETCGKVYSVYR
jgi:hypothetical protein